MDGFELIPKDLAAKEGLWGVENLSYIPGEVGASAVQKFSGAWTDLSLFPKTWLPQWTTQGRTHQI